MEDYIKSNLNLEKLKRTGKSGGGCISQGDVFETNKGVIFVKKNSKPGSDIMFNGEFQGLESIFATNTVRSPKPLLTGKIRSQCFIVMEYLNITHLSIYSAQLGEAFASLHLHNLKINDSQYVGASEGGPNHVDKFGYHTTTCCGFLPLNNDWNQDWVSFYAQQRLEPQISLLLKEKGDRELGELWSQLQLKIPSMFHDCIVQPSLLHGDLWSGNAGETETEGVIFDPGVFYGHHEFDLGIAGMFGGFSPQFYDAYYKLIPKKQGFDQRHKLYQLFHQLNHWNHFGVGYKNSSLSIMKSLCKSNSK